MLTIITGPNFNPAVSAAIGVVVVVVIVVIVSIIFILLAGIVKMKAKGSWCIHI